MRLVNDDTGSQITVKDNQNIIIPDNGTTNSTSIKIELDDGTNGSGIDLVEVRKDDPDTGQILFSDDTDIYASTSTYTVSNLPNGQIFVKVVDLMGNDMLHRDFFDHISFALYPEYSRFAKNSCAINNRRNVENLYDC